MADENGDPRAQALDDFFPFVAIADDHDRWIHQIPESPDWALAVQTLGGMESYREIGRLSEPVMSRRLRAALEEGRLAMDRSLALANATLVERNLGNGLRVRTACFLRTRRQAPPTHSDTQHQTPIP